MFWMVLVWLPVNNHDRQRGKGKAQAHRGALRRQCMIWRVMFKPKGSSSTTKRQETKVEAKVSYSPIPLRPAFLSPKAIHETKLHARAIPSMQSSSQLLMVAHGSLDSRRNKQSRETSATQAHWQTNTSKGKVEVAKETDFSGFGFGSMKQTRQQAVCHRQKWRRHKSHRSST
eukprot:6490246-Amphidinium_carterae.4